MSSFSIVNETIRIECQVPDGISIGKTKYGQGIFTTKPFVKGQVLYTGHYTLLDDDGVNRDITLVTQNAEYPMTTEMHTVAIGVAPNKKRQAFYFDAFMNHSCDPNTYSADEIDEENGGSYKTVALRDIPAGEEITCDYDLFELDSRDKGIDICECGAESCRGFAHGFLFVPENMKLHLAARLYSEVAQAWEKKRPNVLYFKVDPPSGIGIKSMPDGSMHLVATRDFSAGEVLHAYSTKYIDTNVVDTIIMNVQILDNDVGTTSDTRNRIESHDDSSCCVSDGSDSETGSDSESSIEMWIEPKRVGRLIDFLEHTVNRGNGMREYFGFDTYCDHSCSPNGDFVYVNDSLTETVTYALVDIKAGEKITCDYTKFEECRDGTKFECDCGASNCQGIIRG